MVSFPYNLLNGANTANGGKWIGLRKLAVELDKMKTDLKSNIESIQSKMSDTSFVQTRKDGLTTKIKAIPTNFQNKLVQRPDKAATETIQMEYLKLTGPDTTENTLSYRLMTVALA